MNTIISRCYRKEVFIESCAAILYSKECTWYNDSIILRRPPQGRMKSWRIRKRLCMLLLKRKIHALTVIFVGVRSTGIYCRPICRAKLPKPENCTYFFYSSGSRTRRLSPLPALPPGTCPRICTGGCDGVTRASGRKSFRRELRQH